MSAQRPLLFQRRGRGGLYNSPNSCLIPYPTCTSLCSAPRTGNIRKRQKKPTALTNVKKRNINWLNHTYKYCSDA